MAQFNCLGKVADIAEKYLTKGSEVVIEGKLVHHNYTDKEGNKKYGTEIQVNELLLLGSKPQLNYFFSHGLHNLYNLVCVIRGYFYHE